MLKRMIAYSCALAMLHSAPAKGAPEEDVRVPTPTESCENLKTMKRAQQEDPDGFSHVVKVTAAVMVAGGVTLAGTLGGRHLLKAKAIKADALKASLEASSALKETRGVLLRELEKITGTMLDQAERGYAVAEREASEAFSQKLASHLSGDLGPVLEKALGSNLSPNTKAHWIESILRQFPELQGEGTTNLTAAWKKNLEAAFKGHLGLPKRSPNWLFPGTSAEVRKVAEALSQHLGRRLPAELELQMALSTRTAAHKASLAAYQEAAAKLIESTLKKELAPKLAGNAVIGGAEGEVIETLSKEVAEKLRPGFGQPTMRSLVDGAWSPKSVLGKLSELTSAEKCLSKLKALNAPKIGGGPKVRAGGLLGLGILADLLTTSPSKAATMDDLIAENPAELLFQPGMKAAIEKEPDLCNPKNNVLKQFLTGDSPRSKLFRVNLDTMADSARMIIDYNKSNATACMDGPNASIVPPMSFAPSEPEQQGRKEYPGDTNARATGTSEEQAPTPCDPKISTCGDAGEAQ